ncbi:hypothetical protein LRP52_19145 [Photobacterium sp. ZSDE20]|nr:hypothetical protein [Photobacterium sp. ZSDE20]
MKRGELITFNKQIDGEALQFKGIISTTRKKDGKYQVLSTDLRRYTGVGTALVKPKDIV